MADYHCDQCGEDAVQDVRASGCGNARCCTPIWELACDCMINPELRPDLCTCNEAETHTAGQAPRKEQGTE